MPNPERKLIQGIRGIAASCHNASVMKGIGDDTAVFCVCGQAMSSWLPRISASKDFIFSASGTPRTAWDIVAWLAG